MEALQAGDQEIILPFSAFDIEIAINKAGVVPLKENDVNVPPSEAMRIWVLASTGDLDEQGEQLVQSAMNIDYLTKDGKFLWGHTDKNKKIDPENVLGNIDLAEKKPEGLYVEGPLWKGKRKAIEIFNDINNNPDTCPHKASIEGSYKVLITADGEIHKSAIVRNIAFDVNVVNTHTMAGVMKSLHSGTQECNCLEYAKSLTNAKEKLALFIAHEAICSNRKYDEIKSMAVQYLSL